ncbi:hypothetical protein AMEX_G16186 [Astyanax mexicanus]|uniref:Uncharacterized protein n=1 Tax=Astyanax mexicanus TaxID=7994 RepID=A0A8T2LC53_ASTMX|nr:hypothetical protein AMEX_G16186 [Astyanax mexicanus]
MFSASATIFKHHLRPQGTEKNSHFERGDTFYYDTQDGYQIADDQYEVDTMNCAGENRFYVPSIKFSGEKV